MQVLKTRLPGASTLMALFVVPSPRASGVILQEPRPQSIGPTKFWQSKLGQDLDDFWSLGRECEAGQCIVLARVTDIKGYPPPLSANGTDNFVPYSGQTYRSHTISLDVLEGVGGMCAPPVISFNLYSDVPYFGPGKGRNIYTSQMRAGDIWAVCYDMALSKIDEPKCAFKLTGMDDEVLRQLRRLNPMISQADRETFSEARRLSRDPRESILARVVAFSTMWEQARRPRNVGSYAELL